jgi:hypothetical protein
VPGHSDANLTAKVYTDVPALSLHSEIAKLPWIGAHPNALADIRISASATGAHETSPITHTGSVKPAYNLENAQIDAQGFGNSGHASSLADTCAKFVSSVKVSDAERFSHVLSSLVTSWRKDEMAARAGIEPVTK